MRFGSTQIPDEMFRLACDRMLEGPVFTPEDIRNHLLANASETMQKISPIASNHRIIAERVMRKGIKELVAAKQIAQLKRGVWATTRFLAAAAA